MKVKASKKEHNLSNVKNAKEQDKLKNNKVSLSFSQTCPKCGGEGYTIPHPCPTCNGNSRKQVYEKFTVKIPAGIYNGAELRIGQKGDAGIFGRRTRKSLYQYPCPSQQKVYT